MALSDHQKLEIISDLAQNIPAEEIATTRDVSYPQVLKLSKDYQLALEQDTVSQLLNVDKAVLDETMNKLREVSPDELKGDISEVMDGMKGLQILQVEFQTTASALSKRILAFT